MTSLLTRIGSLNRPGFRGTGGRPEPPSDPGRFTRVFSRGACSFSGSTQVLLGNGDRKRIDKIRPGDRVRAYNPITKQGGARKVKTTWVHGDTLVKLGVNKGAVMTTWDHPFWSQRANAYVRAADLAAGDRLLTANNREVRVRGLIAGTERDARAYNLTVVGLHTYFVIVGGRSVLVHNNGGVCDLATNLPQGYPSFRAAKRELGSPGEGNVFDHVVEQSQIKRSGFAPEEINNPFNMNPVSARTNQIKANYYSSKQHFSEGLTVRDWLNGQSFREQYEFGMSVLTDIRNGVIQ